MNKLIQRQNGTVSRTKTLNMAGLGMALIGAVLPAFQIYIAPEIYSALLAAGIVLNQYFRDSMNQI